MRANADVEAVLDALVKVGARLTGSWARGDEHAHSDYDFMVSESRWKTFVRDAPGGWESPISGAITWRIGDIQIEASMLFRRIHHSKRRPSRVVLGREWKTA